MTALREAAQQALEALNSIDVGYRSPSGNPLELSFDEGKCEAAITALRAALAQQDEPETCTWCQDGDSDSGVYATSCGHYFNLEDGTPEDNKMQWCCYCGKKLVQELITEDDDG